LKLAASPDFLQSVWEARWGWVEQDGTRGTLADVWDRCIALEGNTGGVIFVPQSNGTWEAHVAFLPKSREVDRAGRHALRAIFSIPSCRQVVASIASDNRAAIRYARRMGFTHTHDAGTFVRAGIAHARQHFCLTREGWEGHGGPLNG
jgi:hypothetical protein